MRIEEIEEFGCVLGATLSVYDKVMSDDVALLWFEALKEFELADIRVALSRHVKDPDKGEFAPRPSSISQHLAGGATLRSMKAWALVEKAVRCVGHYRSVCFDDPIINKAVDEMGGWVKLASTESAEDLKFRGIDFARLYAGHMQTGGVGSDYPPYLPGAAEAHNAVANMRVEPPALIGDPAKAALVLARGAGSTALKVTSGSAGNVAALTGGVVKKLTGGK